MGAVTAEVERGEAKREPREHVASQPSPQPVQAPALSARLAALHADEACRRTTIGIAPATAPAPSPLRRNLARDLEEASDEGSRTSSPTSRRPKPPRRSGLGGRRRGPARAGRARLFEDSELEGDDEADKSDREKRRERERRAARHAGQRQEENVHEADREDEDEDDEDEDDDDDESFEESTFTHWQFVAVPSLAAKNATLSQPMVLPSRPRAATTTGNRSPLPSPLLGSFGVATRPSAGGLAQTPPSASSSEDQCRRIDRVPLGVVSDSRRNSAGRGSLAGGAGKVSSLRHSTRLPVPPPVVEAEHGTGNNGEGEARRRSLSM